ncbi:MAG TPA: SIR2 family protein [Allosphingosinicella sp.]|nr:SIR2 family protein [Allosphingosinicella sp.]
MTNDEAPRLVDVEHLANAIERAWDKPPERGRAVFLIGAGCSVSAGIPAAGGMARRVAIKLAQIYSRRMDNGAFDMDIGDLTDATELDRLGRAALDWLLQDGRISPDYPKTSDGPDWARLYQEFFEHHLMSSNAQRELISEVVDLAGDKLNWAHACLGELVERRFVHSVLTTNFDQLALRGMIRAGRIPVVADALSTLNRIVARPPIPQLVHLHGSMHTYSLRNSRRAVRETKEDEPAPAMMHQVLQACDVLVVVGYAGGEEGIMDMLLSVARRMDGLVVYWVVHNTETELSPGTRELLTLENKFLVDGGEADKFFGDLMRRLRLGQPSWVDDPVAELFKQRDLLVAPQEITEVRILIEEYRRCIDYAEEHGRDLGAADDPILRAAELRAAGEYGDAWAALAGKDLHDNPEAERLRALNALSLFEEDIDNQRPMLDVAMEAFKSLVGRTTGSVRLANILSLLDALFDLSDVENVGNSVGALNEIVETVDIWLPEYDTQLQAKANLLHYRAMARHKIADPTEDQEKLLDAISDYREAIRLLDLVDDRSGKAQDAREGLAGALQVVGVQTHNVDEINEAIALFRWVSSQPRRDVKPGEEGGVLFNLAGALAELWFLVGQTAEGTAAWDESLQLLAKAEESFLQAGEEDRGAQVQALAKRLRDSRPGAA